jgi:hypothetical protein
MATGGAGGMATGGAGGMATGGAGGMATGGAGGMGPAPSADCMAYCSGNDGVLAICAGQPSLAAAFMNEADCLSKCAAQTKWNFMCRKTHLAGSVAKRNDAGYLMMHCPHNVGSSAVDMDVCKDMP